MRVAVTGHRPERWKTEDERRTVRKALRAMLDELRPTMLISGMCRGVDLWAVEWCVSGMNTNTLLRAVYPFAGYDRLWDKRDRDHVRFLIGEAAAYNVLESEVTLPGNASPTVCYHRRDRYVVDECQALLAVYDGGPGGTKYTVDYARKVGREIRMVTW